MFRAFINQTNDISLGNENMCEKMRLSGLTNVSPAPISSTDKQTNSRMVLINVILPYFQP